MNIRLIVIALVVLVGLALIGNDVLSNQKPNNLTHNKKANSSASNVSQSTNPLQLYPNTSVNCSATASLVQLSADYIVSGMRCQAPAITKANFLSCDGSIFQQATNVSFDCYRSEHYASNDNLFCSGSANGNTDPTNLSLNYSCVWPGLKGNVDVYNCSGEITNYSSFAISLPMTTNCTGA
jgi:hypothetical protein